MDPVQVGPGKTATLSCEITGLVDDTPLTVTWLKTGNAQVEQADTGIALPTDGKSKESQ